MFVAWMVEALHLDRAVGDGSIDLGLIRE